MKIPYSNSNEEAHQAFRAVNNNQSIDEIKNNLTVFQSYLSNLCASIDNKAIKQGFVYRWTFSSEPNLDDKN